MAFCVAHTHPQDPACSLTNSQLCRLNYVLWQCVLLRETQSNRPKVFYIIKKRTETNEYIERKRRRIRKPYLLTSPVVSKLKPNPHIRTTAMLFLITRRLVFCVYRSCWHFQFSSNCLTDNTTADLNTIHFEITLNSFLFALCACCFV